MAVSTVFSHHMKLLPGKDSFLLALTMAPSGIEWPLCPGHGTSQLLQNLTLSWTEPGRLRSEKLYLSPEVTLASLGYLVTLGFVYEEMIKIRAACKWVLSLLLFHALEFIYRHLYLAHFSWWWVTKFSLWRLGCLPRCQRDAGHSAV